MDLELDMNVWKYHQTIIWLGKENISDRHFVKMIVEIAQENTHRNV
jgi:methanophenazine hydrogenase, cytochrome b subunit